MAITFLSRVALHSGWHRLPLERFSTSLIFCNCKLVFGETLFFVMSVQSMTSLRMDTIKNRFFLHNKRTAVLRPLSSAVPKRLSVRCPTTRAVGGGLGEGEVNALWWGTIIGALPGGAKQTTVLPTGSRNNISSPKRRTSILQGNSLPCRLPPVDGLG